MESQRNFIYFLRNLNTKHRLSLLDQHTHDEVWYMHLSPMRVFAGLVAVALLMFVLITMLVAYTPILDLIPGYPGNKSREMLINNVMRLDSMEREIRNMQIYTQNVSLIMDGKTPIIPTLSQENDSLKHASINLVSRSKEDSLFRAQIEAGALAGDKNSAEERKKMRSIMELVPPIKGTVISKFNPKQGHFGVSISTQVNQQILAVEGGTVVLSTWTNVDGYMIGIQHTNNLMSVYKNASSVIKSHGDRVSGGEVIGYAGDATTGEKGSGMCVIELWYNGTPVDPQSYILF